MFKQKWTVILPILSRNRDLRMRFEGHRPRRLCCLCGFGRGLVGSLVARSLLLFLASDWLTWL